MKKSISTLVAAAGMGLASGASADNILFINGVEGGHPYSIQAYNDLVGLGHNVTVVQNPQPLNVYQQYDEVWDMRYDTNMTNQDSVDMGAYLQGGGRMLVLGEHSGFEQPRNISLRNWISQVGGGTVGNYVQGCEASTEAITNAGQIVNQPNVYQQIKYDCATTYNKPGNGFLVTSTANGDGAIIGWNYGDINGAPNSRMLAVWDIEVWETGVNGPGWTDDMETYLSRVPAPGSASLIGLAGLVATRRRRA